MKKKILRILAIFLVLCLALIIAVPFFLESKIAEIVKNKANQNMEATLDFKEANLSLIKSFPNAYLNLQGISLINKAPFEGDTLFAATALDLEMSLKELFKSANEAIEIRKVLVEDARLHIKVDSLENANYDIAIEATTNEEETSTSPGFLLSLKEYGLSNAQFIYDDFSTGMHVEILEMNHTGSGDLALTNSQLQTHTDAQVSFEMDGTRYLNKNKVVLDALLGIDLQENRYSFLENSALINQLPVVFEGEVQLLEDAQNVAISFKTPSSDFKNFLAVIPEAYATDLDQVTTTGNFEVTGDINGVVNENLIPSFTIDIQSQNASFKYPDLPKTVRNVFIDAQIKNETGVTEDTFINLERLSFTIDEDQFNSTARIEQLLGNTKTQMHADGRINLAKLSKAYPLPAAEGLTGILTADITTAFDSNSISNHQYQNTKTSGKASLEGFHYQSDDFKNPIDIEKAALTFSNTTVRLTDFSGKTGQTDFNATGTLTNFLGYFFNKEELEGTFDLSSYTFAVNDFMVEETEENMASTKNEETGNTNTTRVKIPAFLNATVNASANKVLYDNLTLNNVSGQLLLKDETATLNNVRSEIFDGTLALNGIVSTKEPVTSFDMNLGIDGFKIAESFQALDLFKVLAPVAQAFQGKLNSTIKLSGNLKEDMTPNLSTLSGDLVGQLFAAKLETTNAPALAALDNQFEFIDLEALNFQDLKTVLSFNNGQVATQPLNLQYKDIAIKLQGTHTLDAALAYTATLDVPAKYLGTEVNALIAKLEDPSLKELTIPVTANIGGTYTSPKVSTDLTSGVTQLTQQLVEIQKQKLVNQGKDTAKDLIGGLLGGKEEDSTNTAGDKVSNTLGNLLGKKKDSTATDSVNSSDPVKEAASNILGGLLKKKKKDTVN